jgi:hypothetical protein
MRCDSVQAKDLFMSLVLGYSKGSYFLLGLQETFQVVDSMDEYTVCYIP